LLAELHRLGGVSLDGKGGLSIDTAPEKLIPFMTEHGRLYRALRPLVIKLLETEAVGHPQVAAEPMASPQPAVESADSKPVEDPGNGEDEALRLMSTLASAPPPRPGKPGNRASDGTPYFVTADLEWLARRDLARHNGWEFTEPPPHYWD
jgi:hypothetical protein